MGSGNTPTETHDSWTVIIIVNMVKDLKARLRILVENYKKKKIGILGLKIIVSKLRKEHTRHNWREWVSWTTDLKSILRLKPWSTGERVWICE